MCTTCDWVLNAYTVVFFWVTCISLGRFLLLMKTVHHGWLVVCSSLTLLQVEFADVHSRTLQITSQSLHWQMSSSGSLCSVDLKSLSKISLFHLVTSYSLKGSETHLFHFMHWYFSFILFALKRLWASGSCVWLGIPCESAFWFVSTKDIRQNIVFIAQRNWSFRQNKIDANLMPIFSFVLTSKSCLWNFTFRVFVLGHAKNCWLITRVAGLQQKSAIFMKQPNWSDLCDQ